MAVSDDAALAFALEGVRPNPTTSGRMSVSFVLPAGRKLRAGLYLLRLTQGGLHRTRRAVVLN